MYKIIHLVISEFPENTDPLEMCFCLLRVSAPFSQMVWIATTHFGCGKARSRSGKVIVVGHYSPKGNIPEEFDENVKPSKDSFGEEDEDDDDDDEEESYTSSQERKSSNNGN